MKAATSKLSHHKDEDRESTLANSQGYERTSASANQWLMAIYSRELWLVCHEDSFHFHFILYLRNVSTLLIPWFWTRVLQRTQEAVDVC